MGIDGIGNIDRKSNLADDIAIDYLGKILYDMYKAMSMFIRDFKNHFYHIGWKHKNQIIAG